jgi:DNA-binding LacI/PurR family transcriptional regulator
VSCDNFKGGYIAGRHLIDRGHTRIALLCGRLNRPGSANAEARRDGLRKALAESHAHLLNVDCFEVDDYSEDDGIEWHKHRPPDSTAVFCAAGDRCALGLIRAAPELGVSIPKDLAIIGFDDAPTAGIHNITTIRQPLKELSEAAYRMACIEPSRTLARPERVVLAPELIERGTT